MFPTRICNNAQRFLYRSLEKVLGADSHFLLGRWIADARSWATSEEEADWLEYNARNQVTLWGPSGQVRSEGKIKCCIFVDLKIQICHA